MKNLPAKTIDILSQFEKEPPLVFNLTNPIIMDASNHILHALGASPIVSQTLNEIEALVPICSSLVLHVGTLDKKWLDVMIKAGKQANLLGKPVVFDPLSGGATTFRLEPAKRIFKEVEVSIIRGNVSKVLDLLVENEAEKNALEKEATTYHRGQIIRKLAQEHKVTLAITGELDYISDGGDVIVIDNGHPLMTKVIGSGFGASSTVAAFCSKDPNFLWATAAAIGYYSLCGEEAAQHAKGPGTFLAHFLDYLDCIKQQDLEHKIKYSSNYEDEM